MTIDVQGLGPVLDLASAIGLVGPDQHLDASWFTDPGGHVGKMLRDPGQREALLRVAADLLGQDAEATTDAAGRRWIELAAHGGVSLAAVLSVSGGATELGVGARLSTSTPASQVTAYVPILHIPQTGPVTVALTDGTGTLSLDAEVSFGDAAPPPGQAALAGLAVTCAVGLTGTNPVIGITLRGLQLPGQQAPEDLSLSGEPAQLADQGMRLLLGLVQQAAATASGDLAELLALLGIGAGAAIPALPIADLLRDPMPAWRQWLGALLADPNAVQAWLGHLAGLIGHSAAVAPPAAGTYRVTWSLASGLDLAAVIRIDRTQAGDPLLELGVEGSMTGAGTLPGGLEISATLMRVTLGATPTITGLPSFSASGRIGPPLQPGGTVAPASRLFDLPSPAPKIGALRAGVSLGPDRQASLVLAAVDVVVGSHQYPVLDLTNAHVLADVAGSALNDLMNQILAKLGTAGQTIQVLLGLAAPPGQAAWAVPLTTLPNLLADPVKAIRGYHIAVIATDAAGYAFVLDSLRQLLVAPGTTLPVGGTGTAADPWRLPLSDGVAILAWTAGQRLEIGVAVDREVVDLGGGCPRVTLELSAQLVSIGLDGSACHLLSGVRIALVFGARGGAPLRLGDLSAAIIADSAGVELTWSPGGGFGSGLLVPGLAAEIDGADVPITLPTTSGGGLSGDIPWRALELLTGNLLRRLGLSWADELVDLVGWLPGEAATRPYLSLQSLTGDPVAALGVFLGELIRGGLIADLMRRVALLITGAAGTGLPGGVLRGRGDAAAPIAIPLVGAAADAALRIELLAWAAGTSPDPGAAYQPGDLLAWLNSPADGAGSPPPAARIAAALQSAAWVDAAVADLMADRADLAAGFTGLAARWSDTDGMVPAASAALPGATVHDLPGVTHSGLPADADLSVLAGVELDAGAVVVTGPLGPASWPGVADDHVLDLRAAGLTPQSFDLGNVAAQDGPWLVLLPTRADAAVTTGDDGAARQAERLGRVVDAVVTRVAGAGPVSVIGYAAAGHAAAAVAGQTGVTTVVTVATPHGGLGLDILESQPAAGTLQLLAGLLPPADPDNPDDPDTARGRGLLAPLLAAYDATAPLADLTPPATAPVIPDTVAVHCVRGRCDDVAVSRAICAIVVTGLAAAQQAAPPPPAGVPPQTLGVGLNVAVAPPAAPGALSLSVDLAVTSQLLGGPATPALRARIGIGRAGGWLAGGPDPTRPVTTSRHPSLRRATLELDVPLTGTATARLTFHEASALGVAKVRWVVSPDDVPLQPEARLLAGRLAAGLGPLAATGPVRSLADLLGALGLADPGTTGTGATLGLSADGIRRLLIDPRGLLAAVTPATLAGALADLIGAPQPAEATPSQVIATFGAGGTGTVAVTMDLAARTLSVQAAAVTTDAGIQLSGQIEVQAGPSVSGALTVGFGAGTGPNGRLVLTVSGPPLQVNAGFPGAGGLPAACQLAPAPDVAGLAHLLTTVVPAQVLWAGITFLRSLQPGAVALVDPVLRLLGLLDGTGDSARVIVPIGLLADPGHWITHPAVLGDGSGGINAAKLGPLIDVIAAVFGLTQPGPGQVTLPYGLGLAAGVTGGRPSLALSLTEPVPGTALRVAGAVGLQLGGGKPPAPTAELTLALPDGSPLTSAGRVELTVDSSGLGAHLIMPGSGINLQLLPTCPGLAALGTAAVQYALPLVLDAIAGLDPSNAAHAVAVALGDFGDLTALRQGGKFSGTELQALAANPGPELARRLAASLPQALAALASLLAEALPAGYTLGVSGSDLVFSHTAGTVPFALHLTVPGGGVPTGMHVSATVSSATPFPGATLGGTLVIDPSGLTEASLSFAVPFADAIALGPLKLAPLAEIAIGSAPTGGARVAVGLSADATRAVRGVLHLSPSATFGLEAAGGPLAEVLADLVLPPAVDLVLSTTAAKDLLATNVLGGTSIMALLDQVVFTSNNFDPGALDPTQLLTRLLRLAANIAAHAPALPVAPLTVKLSERSPGDGSAVYGIAVSLPPGQRFNLASGDVTVDIEVDSSWITGPPGADGLVVELLRVAGGIPQPFFGMDVRGVGIRVGRSSGPLLDTFMTVDSVALHSLIAVDAAAGVTDAGGQLELTGLRIPVGSADDGSNQVASGVLRDSASSGEPPHPAFSPALALQRHGGGHLELNLRAGPGDGPWWIGIQRSFGPVYIEQVGFGVTKAGDKIVAASVMVDGKVSLLGLIVAVEDLAIGAAWPQQPGDPPLYSPAAWRVGLDGLAVAADTGGVQISGGLRKAPGSVPDYVGMISIKFSVYGISAYGGYSVVTDAGGQFTSLFLFGALVAPIGGPPAFFVTGIGAGVGVNRQLLLPTDLNQFPSYPLLQALDPNSQLADPDTALTQLRAYFPPARGVFWFAAGLSFTSFALVEGIAVLGIEIGDGLDINLLGLARAALPTPAFPLAQIEVALVVRFSSKDGVLWVQAQLTDNSFLLTRDCRLTGGFAYVMWFTGPNAGQFVLTLGGYHPSFHHDGYPVVPRLGYIWNVADVLVIKGESYFALCSEAIMAGTRFEASLTLGPLWAYLRMGADGIVYFDPFRFSVSAFAEIGAGITIDIDLGWFGDVRITISVSLSAMVLLEGPEFRGKASVDLDVTSATISFGDWSDRSTPALGWSDFEAKYIRTAGASPLTVMPGAGVMPPDPTTSKSVPTGGAADPFLVLPEFTLTVTTAAAGSSVTAGNPVPLPATVVLAIGPMQLASVTSALTVRVVSDEDGTDHAALLTSTASLGQFPKGVWAPLPQTEPKPVPTGDTIAGVNGLTLNAVAQISPGTVPIDAHQVEIGPRHQLPFLAEAAVRGQRAADVAAADALAAAEPSAVGAVLDKARAYLAGGAQGGPLSPLAAAVFAGNRTAPPQLVPLTHRMAIDPGPAPIVPPAVAPPPPVAVDTTAHPLRLDALLTVAAVGTATGTAAGQSVTTVGAAGTGITRITAPRLADISGVLDSRYPLRLVMASAGAALGPLAGVPPAGAALAPIPGPGPGPVLQPPLPPPPLPPPPLPPPPLPPPPLPSTVIAAGRSPATGRAGGGAELRRGVGQPPAQVGWLDELTKLLQGGGFTLLAGEAAVLTTDNGHYDIHPQRPVLAITGDLPVRVVALDTTGAPLLDELIAPAPAGAPGPPPAALPPHTERAVVIGGAAEPAGAAGWHAATKLAQAGPRTLIGPGCILTSTAAGVRRTGTPVATAFVTAAEAVAGFAVVTTALPAAVTAVAVIIENAPRVDDDRGDALDLGLTGANRAVSADGSAIPAQIMVSGARTIAVYEIVPDGTGPVTVTVASGEHLHLSGVIGSTSGADVLSGALRRRDISTVLSPLCGIATGAASVGWLPQPAPATTASSPEG